jgi:predicted DNA-binding transcriptional regulator AlpA
VSAGTQGQGGRRSQAQRGAESGYAVSASGSLASRPALRAPTAALSGFPVGRDARVLALLERIASGVEGLRDELRGVAALATLAQEARVAGASAHASASSSADEFAFAAGGSTAASNAPACELLTAADLCSLLKLDARTLRVLRHEGRVPEPIKLGRSLRWRRAEIEAWIAEQGGDARAHAGAGEHP